MAEYMYGIRNVDEKIIGIDEVPNDKSGLKCDCVCPECGRALEACSLQGKVNRYFRHYKDKNDGGGGGNGCDALTANETALHRMAKEIVAEELKIFVPVRKISFKEAGLAELPPKIKDKVPRYEVQPERLVEGRAAEVEKRLGGLKPDVILKTDRGELLIEVFVRHKVDDEKKAKAQEYGSAMLELDLSEFQEKPISREELRRLILTDSALKGWAYYPIDSEAVKAARQYYENIPEVKQYLRANEKKLRQKRLETERKQQQERLEAEKRERRQKKLEALLEPSNYNAELVRLRNDKAFFYVANNEYVFFKNHKKVPWFIDIPITGEMIFQCDRRIWQGQIFDRFIYNRNCKERDPSFNYQGDKYGQHKSLFDELKDTYNIPVDYDLTYKIPCNKYLEEEVWFRRTVIETYLNYLELLGFIAQQSRQSYPGYINFGWKDVKATHTIETPDKEAAEQLLSALKKVNRRSPDIDMLLFKELSSFRVERAKQAEIAKQEVAKAKREAAEALGKERREAAATLAAKRREEHRQRILNFDYDQSEVRIQDEYGYYMAKCTSCHQIVRAAKLKRDLPNINKGICYNCLRKLKSR